MSSWTNRSKLFMIQVPSYFATVVVWFESEMFLTSSCSECWSLRLRELWKWGQAERKGHREWVLGSMLYCPLPVLISVSLCPTSELLSTTCSCHQLALPSTQDQVPTGEPWELLNQHGLNNNPYVVLSWTNHDNSNATVIHTARHGDQ